MPIALPPPCLLGPAHLHPFVTDEQSYLARHRLAFLEAKQMFPALAWPTPWISEVRPALTVRQGIWKIACATLGCLNHPVVSVEWRLALCWDCGAIYERLLIPADIEAIERVLLQRPVPETRNWWLDETLADLIAENAAQGIALLEDVR